MAEQHTRDQRVKPRNNPSPRYRRPLPPPTLAELADKAGIGSAGLKATAVRFNQMVRAGHDDDFKGGDTTYDNFYMWGDMAYDPPHRTLGVIEQGPFYAVKMEAGALGTAGGPKSNVDAQVLDWRDEPIPGLYAAGNAMAAVLGDVYGGAGGGGARTRDDLRLYRRQAPCLY